jgi:hypothetical protein
MLTCPATPAQVRAWCEEDETFDGHCRFCGQLPEAHADGGDGNQEPNSPREFGDTEK